MEEFLSEPLEVYSQFFEVDREESLTVLEARTEEDVLTPEYDESAYSLVKALYEREDTIKLVAQDERAYNSLERAAKALIIEKRVEDLFLELSWEGIKDFVSGVSPEPVFYEDGEGAFVLENQK